MQNMYPPEYLMHLFLIQSHPLLETDRVWDSLVSEWLTCGNYSSLKTKVAQSHLFIILLIRVIIVFDGDCKFAKFTKLMGAKVTALNSGQPITGHHFSDSTTIKSNLCAPLSRWAMRVNLNN